MRGLLLIAVVVLFIGTATAAASSQNVPHRGDPRSNVSWLLECAIFPTALEFSSFLRVVH
jgi:hypothetical protein